MAHIDPRPETSTADLVREAILDAKELLQAEVELAKDEMRTEIRHAKSTAIAMGVAAACTLLGLAMVLVGIALAIDVEPLPALLIGIGLLVVGIIAGLFGYERLPKQPLPATRARLETDVRLLKEHIV
jgi:uncharacterized membrane protein YqjE